jgi:large subunit ribosomal protein L3
MAASESKAPASAKTKSGKKARRSLLGKKIGMTQVYNEAGRRVPVTVIQAGPCTVFQVKTAEQDGYEAVQLGFDDTAKKKKKPQQARLDKLGLAAKRHVREVPFIDPECIVAVEGKEGVVPGVQVGVAVFKDVKQVDVRGVTKGRGFQGVIRRYRFNAGPKSHGTKNIREPKSTGMHTDPGRVHKGKKMPGHMGAALRKARNLDVVRIDEADNLLLVKGSVPGANGGYLYIQESL